jgi:hypothetical protein
MRIQTVNQRNHMNVVRLFEEQKNATDIYHR